MLATSEKFVPGEKCWGVKDVDIYMPAATQNDVRMESAEKIAASGVKYYIEVANMPTTNDALDFLRKQPHMIVAPSKAVNAGGVAVSGLEMSQNSERLVRDSFVKYDSFSRVITNRTESKKSRQAIQ